MFVSRFMTKNVFSIGRESDIAEAKQLMVRYRIRHLPVTRADNTLIGIVSDRDIRSAMPSKFFHDYGVEETERLTGVLVQEIMTKNPASVSLSSTLQDTLLLIEKMRVGAFPVVDGKLKVVGMVSDRDLLNAFIHALGIKEPGALLGIVADENIEEMERNRVRRFLVHRHKLRSRGILRFPSERVLGELGVILPRPIKSADLRVS